MELTIFLARFLGGYYVIFGLLSIITKYMGKVIEMTKDKSFVISTGYITLLIGLGTVILHNVWVLDWTLAITLLGWSTLIKGILKVGFPEVINKQAQGFKNKQLISNVILTLLGAWLIWMSFV